MRISGPVTVSALVMAGLVASGSAARTVPHPAPQPRLAAATNPSATPGGEADAGLVPAAPEPPRKLTAMSASSDGLPLFGGAMPLQEISLPGGPGAFGIPQIVLAAYRNAELALQSSDPGCGLSWNLLAGIGKVESNHAGGGRTDADGTTVGVIYGPALDGTLPGNEVIKASDGAYVRAIGPMQFLPGTWSRYATDAKGNGHPDPNNVFDAALAAGRYLCNGGRNLADPAQQAQAVFSYNHSNSYVAKVLLWAYAYAKGVTPLPSTPVLAGMQNPPSYPGSSGTNTPPPGTTTTTPASTTVPPSTTTGGTTTTTTRPGGVTSVPSRTTPPSSTTSPPTCTTSPTTSATPTTSPTPTPSPTTSPTTSPTLPPCTTPTGKSNSAGDTSSKVTTTP